jgi:uncharacterized membrane protein
VEERFQQIADAAALGMEIVAVAIVTIGAAAALARLVRWTLRRTAATRKDIWRRFALSLMLGLEFMLAADIVRTAISPTLLQIGELAAIAAIRTFLNYFLAADIEYADQEDPDVSRARQKREAA